MPDKKTNNIDAEETKKCDRCGKKIEYYRESYNSVGNYKNMRFDLCVKCRMVLIDFVENYKKNDRGK